MTPPEFKKAAPAVAADYYALLGLEQRFVIDKGELERNYLERSAAVHPDRFVNAPANERVSALQQSMLVNDAYKTVKNPEARAEYLLQRHGVDIGDNERLDPTFLMEVLELREELAEAKHASDRARLERLEEAMHDRRDHTLVQVASSFAQLEDISAGQGADSRPATDVLATIKKHVIVMRYIRRYLDEFDELDDFDADQ